MESKLVLGVGINDAGYVVQPLVAGNRIWCDFYRVWHGMLERCYSSRYLMNHPTYVGCIVCEEWLTFSTFKAWMAKQDWVGKQLDKDLLTEGNKIYSPDNCVFVSLRLNMFLTDSGKTRGLYPIGVSLDKRNGKFRARCREGREKQRWLGYYLTPEEAHLAWKAHKHKLACELAKLETDEKVKNALLNRFKV